MSWSRKTRRGRGYHHGNLREALIEAALALIAEKGPAGFSFAEAARAAGVTPAAPYRHFRDRDALMADVAIRGFETLTSRLEAAWDDGRPEPVAALGAHDDLEIHQNHSCKRKKARQIEPFEPSGGSLHGRCLHVSHLLVIARQRLENAPARH